MTTLAPATEPTTRWRGCGTTFRQVQAAKSGDSYVVPSSQLASYVRSQLVKQGRSSNDLVIRVVRDQRDLEQLRGLPEGSCHVDHFWWEVATPRMAAWVRAMVR